VIGQQPTNSRAALEQALAPLAKKSDERTNVVGELVDMKVEAPGRPEFSPQVHNIPEFDRFTKNPQIRTYVHKSP